MTDRPKSHESRDWEEVPEASRPASGRARSNPAAGLDDAERTGLVSKIHELELKLHAQQGFIDSS